MKLRPSGARIASIGLGKMPFSMMYLNGWLPRAIVAFQRVHPRVRFHISEDVYPDILPAIRIGDLDFAICLVPTRPRDQLHELSRGSRGTGGSCRSSLDRPDDANDRVGD